MKRATTLAVPVRRPTLSDCLGLSPAISSQFTLEMHIAAENRTNTKTLYFGGSRSFKVMIRSISMFICNCFYVRRANIGKITSFYMGTPL